MKATPHFQILTGLALLAAAACDPPPDAAFEPSAAAQAAPEPKLAETARFAGPLAAASPDAKRLAAEAGALAARAAALRDRADALEAPVLAPGDQDRLQAGGGAAPQVADP